MAQGILGGTTLAPQVVDTLNALDGSARAIRELCGGRNGRGQATDLTVTLAGGQVKTLVQGTTHYPYGPAWWWTYGNGRQL